MKDTTNTFKELATEYIRLGGKRRAVLDDNLVSTRLWDDDNAQAERFWRDNIGNLPIKARKDVEKFLPDINAV